MPGQQARVHLAVEERCSSGTLTEETVRSILCPLFARQSVLQSGGVGLLPALPPPKGCWPHRALWGSVLRLPLEFGDLDPPFFLILLCGFTKALLKPSEISAGPWRVQHGRVLRGTRDSWDSSMPSTGPGHPEVCFRFICHPLAISLCHFRGDAELEAAFSEGLKLHLHREGYNEPCACRLVFTDLGVSKALFFLLRGWS